MQEKAPFLSWLITVMTYIKYGKKIMVSSVSVQKALKTSTWSKLNTVRSWIQLFLSLGYPVVFILKGTGVT